MDDGPVQSAASPCPSCGYPIDTDQLGPCPECGEHDSVDSPEPWLSRRSQLVVWISAIAVLGVVLGFDGRRGYSIGVAVGVCCIVGAFVAVSWLVGHELCRVANDFQRARLRDAWLASLPLMHLSWIWIVPAIPFGCGASMLIRGASNRPVEEPLLFAAVLLWGAFQLLLALATPIIWATYFKGRLETLALRRVGFARWLLTGWSMLVAGGGLFLAFYIGFGLGFELICRAGGVNGIGSLFYDQP
ncbi:MAG: hypothetical protein AAF995_04165 [Planctomycetota bacterium]